MAVRLTLALLAGALLLPGGAQAAQRTHVLTYGPITVGGYETRDRAAAVPTPHVDGAIVAMHAVLVDGAGRQVPQTQVMLHHAVFINRGRFDGDRHSTYCVDRAREPFYGTAEEDTPLTLPAGYGYPVHRGDRWNLRYMIMNHKLPTRRVWFRYVVTTTSDRVRPVTPYWVTVACRRERIYNVVGGGAPGAEDVRSTSWTVPRTGRLVALVGHLHGGGRRLVLRQPRCADRVLAQDEALYGGPDDPIYRASPMLHEPSPRSIGVWRSAAGVPLTAGERLQLDAVYDGERPHTKVMGIAHLYVAADPGAVAGCPPGPPDVDVERLPFPGAPGRADPPVVHQDLSTRGPGGVALPVPSLVGPVRTAAGDTTVAVAHFAFAPRRLTVPAGTRVTWRFDDRQDHDVAWADGPRGFGSRYSHRGASYATRLTVPGTYRIFCSLHPVDMAQEIVVTPASAGP